MLKRSQSVSILLLAGGALLGACGGDDGNGKPSGTSCTTSQECLSTEECLDFVCVARDVSVTPDTSDVADVGTPDAPPVDTTPEDTAVPDTVVPDTNVPDTVEPDADEPDTGIPDTFEPDTFVEDTFVEDTLGPDIIEEVTPDTTGPATHWIAFRRQVAEQEIALFLVKSDGTGEHRLSPSATPPTRDFNPVWSADGKKLAFYRFPDFDAGTQTSINGLMIWDGETGETSRVAVNSDELVGVAGFSWSPDGTKLVVEAKEVISTSPFRAGPKDLFLIEIATGNRTQLTDDAREDIAPVFSPNGTMIYFTCGTGSNLNVCSIPAAGGAVTVLTTDNRVRGGVAISPDGTQLVYQYSTSGLQTALRRFIISSRQGTNFTSNRYSAPQFMPGGLNLVVQDADPGNPEIAIIRLTGQAVIRLTNNVAQDLNPAPSSAPSSFYTP